MAARTYGQGFRWPDFHMSCTVIYEKGSRWRCSLTIDLHRDRAETCARGKTKVWVDIGVWALDIVSAVYCKGATTHSSDSRV